MTAQAAVQNLFQALGISNTNNDFPAASAMLVALLGAEHAHEKLTQALHQKGRTITTDRLTGLTVTFDRHECVEVAFTTLSSECLLALRESRDRAISLYVGRMLTSCCRESCPPVQLTLARGEVPAEDYANDVDVAVEGLFNGQTTTPYWPEVCAGFGAVYNARAWQLNCPARLTSLITNANRLMAERLQATAHA